MSTQNNRVLSTQELFLSTLSTKKQTLLQKSTEENSTNQYKKTDIKKLWDFSVLNRSESTVAHTLIKIIPQSILSTIWHEAHQKNFDLISSYMVELDNAAKILAAQHIPMVALKNAGIARGIYHCVGCCPMGDLDVLVKPGDFHKAHTILTENGFTIDTRCVLEEANLEDALKTGGAEYTKVLPNGETLWFELQWRPVAGRWIQEDQEPTADELMERSISIPETEVRLLSPEDNLLQVALHTAKHTYVRAPGIRLHTDVDRIVNFQEINWDLFVKRVLDLRVKTAVYFSLSIPKNIFDTPIPDHVLKQLRPPGWKVKIIENWLDRIGLFNPDEKKFGKFGYILFNCLLYDSIFDLLKGILPSRKWLKEHYKFESNLLLPYYYAKRIANLAFKRVM